MQQRALTRWLVLAGLLIAAFAGTVTILNLTLYSASGFVGSYLHALGRHDVDGALRMSGVQFTSGGTTQLLAPESLGDLISSHLISDRDEGAGLHTVVYGYSFRAEGRAEDAPTTGTTTGTKGNANADTKQGTKRGTTSFSVERTGSRLGFFSAWRFVHSPQGILHITPQNGADFDANGIPLSAKSGAGTTEDYRVLVPAYVELSHSSTYLIAAKTEVLADRVGKPVSAQIDMRANRVFVRQVSKELNRYLAGCVKQKVLLPTGCPMGKPITDRIQNAPTWSMVTYPKVQIVPGGEPGTWQLPETAGTAHIEVQVKSIFDGSLSTFDEDVPFTVRYLINFLPDGSPNITAQ